MRMLSSTWRLHTKGTVTTAGTMCLRRVGASTLRVSTAEHAPSSWSTFARDISLANSSRKIGVALDGLSRADIAGLVGQMVASGFRRLYQIAFTA
jgi:hypothetical protein